MPPGLRRKANLMKAPIFLLDANILYSYQLRDLFITLGGLGLPLRWSRQIAEEFIRARARKAPGSEPRSRQVLRLMAMAVPDWEAKPSTRRISTLDLPDPDDRHVLAAAIDAEAIIVTRNIGDFPADRLTLHGVRAATPDQVLCELLQTDAELMLQAMRQSVGRMTNQVVTQAEWLTWMDRSGCP